MLDAIALGALWGAVLGKYVEMTPNLFHFLQVSIIFLLVTSSYAFSYLIRNFRFRRLLLCALMAASSCVWTAIHNPDVVSTFDRDLNVEWSIGCGESDNELLVYDGSRLYLARGSAMVDDVVVLAKNDLRSRFLIVKTKGYRAVHGPFCRFFEGLRSRLYEVINSFPEDVRSWLSGFVLGRNSDVDEGLVVTFRNLGLLHILVLSGGHLSLIAGMILFLLRLPFLLPYCLKKIPVEKWIVIWNGSSLAACVLLFIFCAVVGFSPTVQRAFLNFVVCHLFPMVGLAQEPKTRIRLTLCLQALIFPVNLLSMSLILSWTGSLLLMALYESTYLKSQREIVIQAAKIQLFFFATTLVFFGHAGILSPVANLIGLPIFGVLLPLDVITILLNINWLNDLMIWSNRLVLEGVRWFAYYQSTLPISFVGVPSFLTMKSSGGRLLIVCLMAMFYLLSGVRQQRPQSEK